MAGVVVAACEGFHLREGGGVLSSGGPTTAAQLCSERRRREGRIGLWCWGDYLGAAVAGEV